MGALFAQQLYLDTYSCCEAENMAADAAGITHVSLDQNSTILYLHVMIVALVTVPLVFHFIRKFAACNSCLYSLPPGPRPWPLIGSLHLLGELPHVTLAKLALKYGPLMTLTLGTTNYVVASSPDMAKQFLKNLDHAFAKRPHTLASSILAGNNTDLTFSDGSYWRHLRKICMLELFTAKRIELFRAARAEELGMLVKNILEESREGKHVDFHFKVWCLSANNMTRMLMSKRYFGAELEGSQNAQRFKSIVEDVLHWFTQFFIGDFNPALRWVNTLGGVQASMRKVSFERDAFLLELIDEHRQRITAAREQDTSSGDSATDFIDVLLSMPSENGQGHLPDSTILAVIQDMLVGGADTSSITMEWTMAEILHHPHVMSRVQEELDAVVGKTRLVQESDIPNLKYLRAVVKESFRLHPAVPLLVPHESTEACQVAGYTLPPRTALLVNVWAMGRDAKFWQNPLAFNPERFLDHPEIDVKGQNFELLPFGTGRRGCVGISLGMLVIQLTLAHLLHTFDWSLPDRQDPSTLNLSERFKVSSAMKHPLHALIAKPRLAAHVYSSLI